mmetsp:Transcript_22171/g.35808  ORF Transcript_22171/g.35808 Transcript_22171/m.35808 type:complete len:636 (-) Transcript_22171:291-2198(-)
MQQHKLNQDRKNYVKLTVQHKQVQEGAVFKLPPSEAVTDLESLLTARRGVSGKTDLKGMFYSECSIPFHNYLRDRLMSSSLDHTTPQGNLVIFWAHNDDALVSLSPLLKHMLQSSGMYTPLVVATGEATYTIDIAKGILSSSSSFDNFNCHFTQALSTDVESIQLLNAAVAPLAHVVVRGLAGWEHLRANLDRATGVGATVGGLMPVVLALPAGELARGLLNWIATASPYALLNWSVPQVTVAVITANRPAMLRRLLDSLSRAHYLGDQVDLVLNTESFSDLETMTLAHEFFWPFGDKVVRHRIKPGGLMGAVMESWYPASMDHYGVLLEDDIEVAPDWYVWCKEALMAYRYGNPQQTRRASGLYGVSLYTPRVNELDNQLKTEAEKRWDPMNDAAGNFGPERANSPYVQALACSWGALFFPWVWAEFTQFAAIRHEHNESLYIEESNSNGWKASWKKYFYEMTYLNNYYMLYPNFQNQTSLSTNHMGAGVHIKRDGGDAKHSASSFTVPLVGDLTAAQKQLPIGLLPPIELLPGYDLLGRPVVTSSHYLQPAHAQWAAAGWDVYRTARVYDAYLHTCAKYGDHEAAFFHDSKLRAVFEKCIVEIKKRHLRDHQKYFVDQEYKTHRQRRQAAEHV